MLNEFQVELSTDKSLSPKHLPHYIRWVKDCYSFLRLPPTERLSPEQTRLFFSNLEKSVTTDIKRTRFALAGEPTRKLLSSRFLGRMSPITTSEERCPFSVWPEIGGIIFRR
jgi:hypothetical protein